MAEKSADRSEAKVRDKCFTEDQTRAAANRLAASAAAAAGAAGRPDKQWSALAPRQQRNRLRVGHLHLKKAIDEAVGIVGMLADDGTGRRGRRTERDHGVRDAMHQGCAPAPQHHATGAQPP